MRWPSLRRRLCDRGWGMRIDRLRMSEHLYEVSDDVQLELAHAASAVTAGLGLALWLVAERLSLEWAAARLGLGMLLVPCAVFAIAAKHRQLSAVATTILLTLLVWLAWLATGEELVWVLLLLPVAATTLLAGHLPGAAAALAASGVVLWRLPLWLRQSAVQCCVALLAIWFVYAVVRAAVRGAALAASWAQERHDAMRSMLDEALDQRLELKQTRDDLVQANTQLERLADRLAIMTEVAQEANRTKERFLANVSHELRTPLNMIIGFSEMITQSPDIYEADLPGSLLADIMVIHRNSQHLASLVNDILDLSRTEAGHLALTREWVALGETVQEAVRTVGPLFETKGLYLHVDSEPDLPEVYCDRTRVRQVLLNLLSNAGRFTVTGGVTIALSADAAGVTCRVADTGKGIPPDDRERIFEPFYQTGPGALQRTEGTGLGLSISRSLVELHGGSLWLESELGKGSTFYFRLPVVQPQTDGVQNLSRWFSVYGTYEERDRPTLAPPPKIKPRLVVLEAGTALATTLRRHAGDAQVVSVCSLDEATRELGREPADALVVNDEAAQAVLQRLPSLDSLPHGTPAVVCWMPADEEIAAELGVTRYFIKPIERAELLACLDARGPALETILIVDDDPEALQMLARMILAAHRPYRVLRATKPVRALELMRLRQPDLVLLDMYLPEMSGFELLRVKAQDPSIAGIEVIAVSAHDPTMSLSRGNSLTLVHQSPLTVRDLLAGIRLLKDAVGQSLDAAPRGTAGKPLG
jgi:signal transduction histidine kinase/CheY-like chemotaxis protein